MLDQIKAIFELYANLYESPIMNVFTAQDSILRAYHDGLLTFTEMKAYYAYTLTGDYVRTTWEK